MELVFADRLDVIGFIVIDIAHLQIPVFDDPAYQIVLVFDVDVNASFGFHLRGGERDRDWSGQRGVDVAGGLSEAK